MRLISGEARSSTANGIPRAASWSRTRGRPLGHEVLPVAEIVERRLRAAVLGSRQRAPEEELLGVLVVNDALHRDVPQTRLVLHAHARHVAHPLLASGEDERQLELLQGVAKRTAADEARALQDAHLLELALRKRARELVVVEEGVVLSLVLARLGLVAGVPVLRDLVVVLAEQLPPAQHVPDARRSPGRPLHERT